MFTIHTPVSAGNERFDADLVRRVAGPLLDGGGVPVDKVLELGLGVDGDAGQFDMTAFSLRLTNGANAVSKLHGETANGTWQGIIDKPILGLTNGVHAPTWIGRPIVELLDAASTRTSTTSTRPPTRAGSGSASSASRPRDLWEAHLRQKRELALFARGRLRSQFARHGEAPAVLARARGRARPGHPDHRLRAPVRDVQAGRPDLHRHRPAGPDAVGRPSGRSRSSSPARPTRPTGPGQRVIQEIFQRSRSPQLRGRVFILEDYDMRVGRFLVQGVDVWLNNPRRPLEASGTSGMKAAQNGVPNVSVLDGWWDEGYEGDNGWAIGGRGRLPDEAAQDWHDALDLYRLLEDEIVPSYYDRDAEGLPRSGWRRMRRAMATTLWQFSTTRMLHEYTEQLYLPAAGVPVAKAESAPLLTEAG